MRAVTRKNSYHLPNSDNSLILKFDTTAKMGFRSKRRLDMTGKGNVTVTSLATATANVELKRPRTAQPFDLEMSTRKTTILFCKAG